MISADSLREPVQKSKLLYHYTNSQAAIQHILPSRELKFNSVCNTNDPLEFMDLIHVATGISTSPDDIDSLASKGNRVNDLVKRVCKIACFSSDYPLDKGWYPFQKGFARARMWSQYAESHQGVCLLFDAETLLRTLLYDIHSTKVPLGSEVTVFHGNVIYDNSLAKLHTALTIEDTTDERKRSDVERMSENAEAYLFTKLEDYRDEQEFRFALYSSKGFTEGGHILIKYAASLVGVILGCKFKDDYRAIVDQFSKEMNLPVIQMVWQNGEPTLEDVA